MISFSCNYYSDRTLIKWQKEDLSASKLQIMGNLWVIMGDHQKSPRDYLFTLNIVSRCIMKFNANII